MKKKYIVIAVIAIIAVAMCVWMVMRPEPMGNINGDYSEPATSASNITFSGETGDRIKFSFASDIKNGELDIKVYDSKGNVVKELDRADKLETFFDLEYSDTYKLQAEYKDFIGKFKVKIYKIESR